jgi:hypothetical protein
MAHANVHLAAGIWAGTAVAAVPLVRAWLAGRPVARPIVVMIVAAYGLGLWAIAPNILIKLGLGLPRARWTDVFVLHATLDHRIRGGLLVGELAIAAAFVIHYVVIIAALVRARRRPRRTADAG